MFITECLKSVIDQSYKNLEIIVVNDGSSDETIKILEKFHSIKVYHQANSGACSARNLGLKKARGKYIKFLDSDDILFSNAIEKQVETSLSLPEDYIVYGDYFKFDQNHEKYFNTKLPHKSSLVSLILFNIPTPAPLHKKRFLDAVGGFDERFTFGQETDLHIRLASSGVKFTHEKKNIFKYRQHTLTHRISNLKTSEKATMPAKNFKFACYTFQKVEKNLGLDGLQAFACRFWGIGRKSLRCNDFQLANKCFEMSRRCGKDYRSMWRIEYKILYHLFGVRITENLLSFFGK
jgi:glycosyltransferase involved in cell wall biosynthesis